MMDSLLEVITERGSQTFYKPMDVKCFKRDWDKYDFSWGYIIPG